MDAPGEKLRKAATPMAASSTAGARYNSQIDASLHFFVIDHHRRKILHFNVTAHPTAEWVCHQLREAFPIPGTYQYAILDRDAKFSAEVLSLLRSSGIEPVRTAIRSPWQNGRAERCGWKLPEGMLRPCHRDRRSARPADRPRIHSLLSMTGLILDSARTRLSKGRLRRSGTLRN